MNLIYLAIIAALLHAQGTYKGTVRGPIYAVGGETTGWILEMDNRGYELKFAKGKEHDYLADQKVTVTGFVEKKRPGRRIIHVLSLKEEPPR